MRLGDAIYQAMGGQVREVLSELAEEHGSMSAAAREIGVPPSTFRAWSRGRKPRAGRLEAILGSNDAFIADGLTVTATYTYEKNPRERTIDLTPFLFDGWAEALGEAYAAGAGAAELGAIVAENLSDPAGFYERTFAADAPADNTWDVSGVAL